MNTSVMSQAVKAALIAITTIAPAREALSATITVHEPDGEGRVFVDVVGTINDEDFKTFTEKTDQIYPIGAGHPNKQVIVTLMSYGGKAIPAVQIGDRIRKRSMSTFVPADRTCTSACALIWLAGSPRTVGDTPQIGFHAVYDPTTRRETGAGNAVVGAYLRDLGIGYKAIVFMTRKGPTSVEWLTPNLAKELGVAWAMLQPPRAIPIPSQPKLQPRPQPPLKVIAAWSQSARSQAPERLPIVTPRASPKLMPVVPPVTSSPEPGSQQQRAPTVTSGLFTMRTNMEAVGAATNPGGAVRSISECEENCARWASCKVFTYSKIKGMCYFYSTASFVPNADFDSGERMPVVRPVTTSPDPVPQQAPTAARHTASPQDDVGPFVSRVLGSTELHWKQIFAHDARPIARRCGCCNAW